MVGPSLTEKVWLMSVRIRLLRGGRVSLPIYNIVVADSRSARDKKFIERLGFWAPKARGKDVPFSLNEPRLAHWVGHGAQVTDVVARLMVKYQTGPEAVRQAFETKKQRRIKTAAVVAKQVADAETRKANAAAKKEAAAAAETAAAEAAEAAKAEAAAAEAAKAEAAAAEAKAAE
jgi:small subunit ribosomal protein S16